MTKKEKALERFCRDYTSHWEKWETTHTYSVNPDLEFIVVKYEDGWLMQTSNMKIEKKFDTLNSAKKWIKQYCKTNNVIRMK